MNIQTIIESSVDQFVNWVPSIAAAIIVFIVFYFLGQLVKSLILHSGRKISLDLNVAMLLARTSRIAIVVLGLVTALGTLGINISAIVAGLGLTGFALGFALKDSISNLLSGVLILVYQPFKIGNAIKVSGHEGIVKAIDLRYTELEADGNHIFIPNSKLFTDPLVVYEPTSLQ